MCTGIGAVPSNPAGFCTGEPERTNPLQVVDCPPGTSDEHLSIVQYLATSTVDGAVIVTTPQVTSPQPNTSKLLFFFFITLKPRVE